MDQGQYEVVVSAGSLRPEPGNGVVMPHRWTADGVVVQTEFTGAHLFHLSAAGCVLNDVYREAGTLGIEIEGVRVRAYGGFAPATWASTGIEYDVDIACNAADHDVEHLLQVVDDVAEIPKALRSATSVVRGASPPGPREPTELGSPQTG